MKFRKKKIFLLASEKERDLEKLYHESKIPDGPDESQLKELLLNCLEQHYGNLDACIARVDANSIALKEITEIVDRVRNRI